MQQLPVLSSPLLAIIATLTGAFLGLAVAVQVIQELWKYLSSSKATTYAKVLADFLGPWTERLYAEGATLPLQVRGPLQWFRVRPRGVLLPMTKDQLLSAMDRIQGGWLGRSIEALKAETRIQQGSPTQLSPRLVDFRNELEKADGETPGYRDAQRLSKFFDTWVEKRHQKDDAVDAAALLEGFYETFVPDRRRVEENYPQFEQNLAYAYQRRNLRQTFFFGFLIAVVLGFPADKLYSMAKATPEDRAFEFLNEVVTLAEEIDPTLAEKMAVEDKPTEAGAEAAADNEATADADSGLPKSAREDLQRTRRLVEMLGNELETGGEQKSAKEPPNLEEAIRKALHWRNLLFCAVTAVFVSFGAPFWHRLSEALVRSRGVSPKIDGNDEARS